MEDLITVLEEQLIADGVVLKEYDDASGLWGDLIESLVDELWADGYPCDAARERFGSNLGKETMRAEIRFDVEGNFSRKGIETTILSALKSKGMNPRHVSDSSKYGNKKIFARATSEEELIVNLDELSQVDAPYITLYLRRISEVQEESKKSHISYSGVVLDDDSKEHLQRLFKTKFPDLEGWKLKCDHVTICLGPIPKDLKDEGAPLEIGKSVQIMVNATGMSDKVCVAQVSVVDSAVGQAISDADDEGRTLHITLALGPDGKSRDANTITDWHEMDDKMKVIGHVKEVIFDPNSAA